MVKHKLLFYWTLIFALIVLVLVNLFVYFDEIRIKLAIILLCLLIFFIFYPIIIIDKRLTTKSIKKEKVKKIKEKKAQLDKKEEEIETSEQQSINSILNTNSEERVTDITQSIICKYCGKSIDKDDEDEKICLYCREDLTP